MIRIERYIHYFRVLPPRSHLVDAEGRFAYNTLIAGREIDSCDQIKTLGATVGGIKMIRRQTVAVKLSKDMAQFFIIAGRIGAQMRRMQRIWA